MSEEEIKKHPSPTTDIHIYLLDKYESIGYDNTQSWMK